MSSLKDRLERIKKGFLKQAPPAAVEIMERATEDLRQSGILSGIPVPGSSLPSFHLQDTEGEFVSSTDLLKKGPLVISFYRGVW